MVFHNVVFHNVGFHFLSIIVNIIRLGDNAAEVSMGFFMQSCVCVKVYARACASAVVVEQTRQDRQVWGAFPVSRPPRCSRVPRHKAKPI